VERSDLAKRFFIARWERERAERAKSLFLLSKNKKEKDILTVPLPIYIPLFADDMILYLKDPKNSTQKLLDTINCYSKVAGYKINL
jgi:hypothetical protein